MRARYIDQQVDWIDVADLKPGEGLVIKLVNKLKNLAKQGFDVHDTVPVVDRGKPLGLFVVSRRSGI